MIRKEDMKIDEDVIVINQQKSKYNEIGQIWKVKVLDNGGIKVSVCFDGEVYNYKPEDLVLA